MAQTPQDLNPSAPIFRGMPHKFEAHPDHPAVAYLVRLHADLGGRIQQNKLEAERLQEAARNVEAVIQLFDPKFNLQAIAPRRRQQQNKFFKRGTIFRQAVDVLRRRGEPMTVADITTAVLIAAKVASPSEKDEVDLRAAIRASLEHNAGKLVERVGEAIPKQWRLL